MSKKLARIEVSTEDQAEYEKLFEGSVKMLDELPFEIEQELSKP